MRPAFDAEEYVIITIEVEVIKLNAHITLVLPWTVAGQTVIRVYGP